MPSLSWIWGWLKLCDVTCCGDEECGDVGACEIGCCCLRASCLCSVSLCVLEGLWVSFVRVGDSFCSLDRCVDLVSLNAGCCKCVGDPRA